MNETVLTREKLYKKIWESPIRSVAEELGVSDVGLAKICKRNGIPKPPQGYHLKKPGYAKDRLVRPLPPIEQGQLPEFIFNKKPLTPNVPSNMFENEYYQYLATHNIKLCAKNISLINNHIKQLKPFINRKNLDERGIIVVPDYTFPIRVSPALYERTESLLKTFLTKLVELEATSLPYRDTGYRKQMSVTWFGYDFDFQFEENSKRIHIPKKLRPKRSYDFPSDAWKLVPTGLLSLKINGPGYGTISIRDGRRLIEERLDDVIKKMLIQAREKQEKEHLETVRMDRAIIHLKEKDKVRREIEFQELRKKQLILESKQWHRAESLRDYVLAVKNAGYQVEQAFESESSWNEWIIWASDYVDSLNPITSGATGQLPPYPEEKEITEVPSAYLDYDDPKEAEEEMSKYWWNQ